MKYTYTFCIIISLLLLTPEAGADTYRRVLIRPQASRSSDGSSRSLTAKAWNALKRKNYESVYRNTDKCFKSFSNKALDQQSSLASYPDQTRAHSYWALNDVATCLFIKGQALVEEGKHEEAKKIFLSIIEDYSYSQCWDTGGWFWKITEAAKDQMFMMENNIDFGNYTSEDLTEKAWLSYKAMGFDKALIYIAKCRELYERIALKQEKDLEGSPFPSGESAFKYWALNDVATCSFIEARIYLDTGKKKRSRESFERIIKEFPHAQCWESKGWFWRISEAAEDQILFIDKGINFEDYKSSTLARKAWKALSSKRYEDLKYYTDKCIALYEKTAILQQASVTSSVAKNEKGHELWALNDVATCYFVKAKAHYNQKQIKQAEEIFKRIQEDYPDAQCWDPRGWFWGIKSASKDHLIMIAQGIDFGDYSSQVLTTKAWKAYDEGDLEASVLYIKKCFDLYEPEARRQQASLKNFAPRSEAYNYWALNDIGTCYYILGKILFQRSQLKEALKTFRKAIDDFSYAQCWDPRGWFWNVAQGARMEAGKIQSILASRKKEIPASQNLKKKKNVCKHATVHRGYI